MPPFTAASEIEPVYDPAASAAEVTVTVNVLLIPLASVAEAGDTASQPAPFPIVAVGITVTVPAQLPMTPIVKVCDAGGLKPCSVEKVSASCEGFCKVHCGCTARLTVIVCGAPTGCLVTPSTAVIVTVPE